MYLNFLKLFLVLVIGGLPVFAKVDKESKELFYLVVWLWLCWELLKKLI